MTCLNGEVFATLISDKSMEWSFRWALQDEVLEHVDSISLRDKSVDLSLPGEVVHKHHEVSGPFT